jgi:exopolysaccharide biosynthesis polyprenyl glycosylphosphotransferase
MDLLQQSTQNPARAAPLSVRARRALGHLRLNSHEWLLLDLALAMLATWLAYGSVLRFDFGPFLNHPRYLSPVSASLFFGFLVAGWAHVVGLHDPLMPRSRWWLAIRAVSAVGFALACLALVVFVALFKQIGRQILLPMSLLTVLLLIELRLVVWSLTEQWPRRLLLLGTKEHMQAMASTIQSYQLPVEVVGQVETASCLAPASGHQDESELATFDAGESLIERVLKSGAAEVVVCAPGLLTQRTMLALVECQAYGLRVNRSVELIERALFHVPVESVRPEWFLRGDMGGQDGLFHPLKRAIDLSVSLLGLPLSGPVMLLAGALMRLESKGPVFFSQKRIGRFGVPFRIWKLRTMRADAEESGPDWTLPKDARVTLVGRLVRKTRIDELPQLWNVLLGEMSLVGPRPECVGLVEQFTKQIPFYSQRHLVRPALTGWAQIMYPYGSSVQDAREKLKYDLYYLKHASLGLDLQIMLRTIGVVMRGSR